MFNTALALDSGKVKLTGLFPDAWHPIPYRPLHHPRSPKYDELLPGYSSVAEIFEKSSNIGSAQEGEQVGPEAQKRFMEKLGLTRKLALEVPEVGTPQVPHPWRPINMMTIAFGHGIFATPVQLVSAICAIANGGILAAGDLDRAAPTAPCRRARA